MKHLLLLACTVLIATGFKLKYDSLDNVNGFESFKFGTSVTNYQGLELDIVEGHTKLYNANPSSLHIEGLKLNYLRLTFINDKLSAIAFATGNSSGPVILNYFKNKYGEPTKMKNELIWKGYKIKLHVEPFNKGNDAIVNFYNN